VIRVSAIEFQFGFKRNAISQASFDAFINRIPWRIDKIIKELENKIVSSISDRKVFGKNFKETLIHPVVRIGLKLKEVLEGFQLNI
jgi:hypothetical protein